MRTLILGLDAFDPVVFERLYEQGKMPNLGKYADSGRYSRFSVSNPPQSEVSWTSIATGLNPGGHGIFDFVHRNPASYALHVSLLPTSKKLGGLQFVSPHSAHTIFDEAVKQGFPATSLWWPATFPAQLGSPVRTIPGLGTPDIHGRLGIGTLFSSDVEIGHEDWKTRVERLNPQGKSVYTGVITGPGQRVGREIQHASLEFQLELGAGGSAVLRLGGQAVPLEQGQWSPIQEMAFKVGKLFTLSAVTRVILTHTDPEVRLYMLPLQLHPLRSSWPYANPGRFAKDLWKRTGPFPTLGWPQDTIGLEDGCIDDTQFLDLCRSVFETRQRIFLHQLKGFREGVLAAVFDTLDRVQHMFWRDRPGVVEEWYVELDAFVGRAELAAVQQAKPDLQVLIVSDHGFTDFNHKVHLNRWLLEHAYLEPKEAKPSGDLLGVDWARSKVYAVGLNSLYLNLEGREGQGSVPADQVQALTDSLVGDLANWQGPDGRPVLDKVWLRPEVFEGALTGSGPDLVVGYSRGYRASSQTGLGAWEELSVEANRDHWGADHCVSPKIVPGVLFARKGLSNFPRPSYLDIPQLAIGMTPTPAGSSRPQDLGDEDLEVIEDRLRSLGYF